MANYGHPSSVADAQELMNAKMETATRLYEKCTREGAQHAVDPLTWIYNQEEMSKAIEATNTQFGHFPMFDQLTFTKYQAFMHNEYPPHFGALCRTAQKLQLTCDFAAIYYELCRNNNDSATVARPTGPLIDDIWRFDDLRTHVLTLIPQTDEHHVKFETFVTLDNRIERMSVTANDDSSERRLWSMSIQPNMDKEAVGRAIRAKLTGVQSGTECPICTEPYTGSNGHVPVSCNYCTKHICGICSVKNIGHNQGCMMCPFCRNVVGHRSTCPGQTQGCMINMGMRLGMTSDELCEVLKEAGTDSDTTDDASVTTCSNPSCSNAVDGTRTCNGCQQAFYCSRNCQKRHWKAHKKQCRSRSKRGGGCGGNGPPLKKPPRDGGCGGGGTGVVL